MDDYTLDNFDLDDLVSAMDLDDLSLSDDNTIDLFDSYPADF